ncbi:Dihydrofolate reductase [Chlamydia avium]|uniref:dihydrofolate reductase n=1 Tax=Chlamydia avium TaxID=1457141 RepID=A0ABP2X7P2_9CHLA|nr:dihydrofolate reductase [Chlamydia avium]EPP36211.1 dihydrofolate reductase family protein [Chlamydia psittaci 10_743_SC13]EPP38692.1 dihydrofolate reductase family protein [Chlamydia avium]VVT43219.1 Dihydrofolate reductase [Chlamydia avium]
MKIILGIAACDPRGTIGKGNRLPWDYPEDLRFFSHVIGKYPIVMGRKTWEGLPKHHCVHRKVIVFSRHTCVNSSHLIWVSSLEEFDILTLPSPIFVIGGGEIFSLFLENYKIRGCFLTHIRQCYDGEIIFPLSLLEGWKQTVLHQTRDLKFCYYENYSYCYADDFSIR